MMPTEQADRIARVYSAVGIGRELRTSNFLLALMAAAAEHYRNEAEDRIEELEGAAEIVSEEFEGDCWKAVRTLLERVGWTDFSEGVTAQDACEIIGDAIRESRSQAQALTAERDGLQTRVGELEGALKPFAEACAESDEGTPHDNTTAWETGMAMGVTHGDFRQARALLTPPAPHSDGER